MLTDGCCVIVMVVVVDFEIIFEITIADAALSRSCDSVMLSGKIEDGPTVSLHSLHLSFRDNIATCIPPF